MPFDVLLSRATSFDALDRVEPLVLAELPPPPKATRQADGSYWIEHPHGEPWLVAAQSKKSIALSSSYSHHRFIRNFLDSFDLALSIAASTGVHVFETVRGSEVTPANVNALLAMESPFVTHEIATHRATRERIGSEGLAPLEYPVGPIDLVSDYFVFHLRASAGVGGDALRAALFRGCGAARMEAGDGTGDAFLVAPVETRGFFARTFGAKEAPTTKVLARPDGAVQVWPTWEGPFARHAKTTLDVVETLERELGATTTHVGHPLDANRRRELRARQAGLGVETYLYQAGG